MNTNTIIRQCPRCNDTHDAPAYDELRGLHTRGERTCPSCGHTAPLKLFRRVRLQPATNGRVAHADQRDADGDDARELHRRACEKLDRIAAVLATGAVTFAFADVALLLNIVRLLVVR